MFMCERASLRKHRLVVLAANRLVWQGEPDNPENDELLGALNRLEDAADGKIKPFAMPRSFPPFGVEVISELGNASTLANLLFADDDQKRIVDVLTRSWCRAGAAGNTFLSNVAREAYGDPFNLVSTEPAWISPDAISLAQRMYNDRDFTSMPDLGAVLEDAGCDHTDILFHCRSGTEHVLGCWVVDSILGMS